MKIRIEVESGLPENEVVIRCRELDSTVQKIQQYIAQACQSANMIFYKDSAEYYLPLESILFFETSPNGIDAHTANDVFQTRHKLYELEELLPLCFIRISKSTILNVDHIYSIDRNLTSAARVQFTHSHKQVYVSRNYYKALKTRIEERRNYHA